MRAVFLELPEWIADQRRRWGHDHNDEVWEGVLHVSPQPKTVHLQMTSELHAILRLIAKRRGFKAFFEPGHYQPTPEPLNYRAPDVVVVSPEHLFENGIAGRAELVVEVLSKDDESRAKLSFYAASGTPEAWLIDPVTYALEVFDLRGGTIVPIAPRADGSIVAPSLGLVLTVTPNTRLEIRDGDDVHVVE